jgi:hypothetical protein
MENEIIRAQLKNPLDEESKGILKQTLAEILKDVIIRRNRIQLTLPAGAVNFNVQSSYMVLTAGAGVTIATIKGGQEGMILTLEFTDGNVTITDTATGASDTVNLSGAFTGSADDTMQLIHNGTSWRELSRSVN